MFGMWNTFNVWSYKGLQETKGTKDNDNFKLIGALSAEEELATEIRRLGHSHVALRRRLYNPDEGCNSEIDLIVVTTRAIYVVEVKNWKGDIWSNNNCWFQRAFPGKRALQFPDIYQATKKRIKVVRSMLASEGMSNVPSDALIPVVVMMSPNSRLDSSITANPHVFTKAGFLRFLGAPPLEVMNNFWSYMPSWLGGATPLGSALAEEAWAIVAKQRTWDTVRMHNGMVITGDICGITADGIKYDRHEVRGVTVEWSSSSVFGLFGALWNGYAAVVTIQLGKHRKGETRRFPIKTTSPTKNCVRIKGAGKGHIQEIPLTKVASVETSTTRKGDIATYE